MENTIYAGLTRQSGLMREIQTVAHNLANASTTGFRREGIVFSEYVVSLENEAPSLSMGAARVRQLDTSQGDIEQTNATFDFAIQGEGFFLVETPEGEALTRAGAFTPSGTGELVTPDGHLLLDAGGAPIFVPPDAEKVTLAQDGTLAADDVPLAQVGLWRPDRPEDTGRQTGTLLPLRAPPQPVPEPLMLQGHLEGSNVDPVGEVARMIEVQRAYELGQKFLEREDERMRAVVRTLGQS